MQTRIDIENRREAASLRRGLADPMVRAFVKVIGTLLLLPDQRSKERVLRFVSDKLDADREAPQP